MTRRLFVTADDFGLHPAINAAVEHAHRHGILTHASMLTAAPAFEQALDIARRNPALSVGVHLSFPGSLEGAGLISLLLESCRHAVIRRRIAEAWRAQIDALIQQRIRPTHLDSHQHVHLFPGLFSVVLDLAAEFDIPRIRMLNLRRTRSYRAAAAALNMFQSTARLLSNGAAGIATPAAWGFHESGAVTAPVLHDLIERAARDDAGVGEIFCHPGNDNPALQQSLGWGYDWEGEMHALCDPAVIDRVRRMYPR